MEEVWKDIEGYEGKYQVSNHGNVKRMAYREQRKLQGYSYKEMIMKQGLNNSGYMRIALWKDGKNKKFYVHRLVAIAFIDNPHNLPQVNHDDGNKTNNHVSNLEWMTISQNKIHAIENKLFIPNTSALHPKKPVAQLDRDTGEVLDTFESVTAAMKATGVGHVSAVCRNERKHAGGDIYNNYDIVRLFLKNKRSHT